MISRFILFLIMLSCYSNITLGQNDSTLTIPALDSTSKLDKKKIKDSLSLEVNNKPKKAFLFGALIPAGGQVYNKDWIKLPFVVGGYTAIVYNYNFKQNRFKEFNSYYSEALACKCKVTVREEPYKIEWDAKQIKLYRDRFRDNRDVAIFIGVGAHLIIALEAYVHAHLKDFNIDQDLSFKIRADQGSIGFVYNLH